MIPILTSRQVQEVDEFTIENNSISSLELMEQASKAFARKFLTLYEKDRKIHVFSGIGNNGGDGMAIARLLSASDYEVYAYVIGNPEKASDDFSHNYKRLNPAPVLIESEKGFPEVDGDDVIIEGIFGSGLSRPIEGIYADLVSFINSSGSDIVSIDIASGLYADQPVDGVAIIPTHTISFQIPKLSFYQPGLARYVGKLHLINIGLDRSFIFKQETSFYQLELADLIPLIPERSKFDHKGDAGRLLLVVGSVGKVGAAVLAARASLRAGAGLLFTNVPRCGVDVVHASLPESMVIESGEFYHDRAIEVSPDIDVIGIGPGIGTNERVQDTFRKLIEYFPKGKRLVLDADGINILAENKELLKKLPPRTILTPHPGEFKRLAGGWENDYEKLEKLSDLCRKYTIDVVLKGANSAICNSRGTIIFNSTGNPGMATAGSGDVLFGMICGLLSQGVEPETALLLGVGLHGRAGDLAVRKKGEISLIASDLIDYFPLAIKKLRK